MDETSSEETKKREARDWFEIFLIGAVSALGSIVATKAYERLSGKRDEEEQTKVLRVKGVKGSSMSAGVIDAMPYGAVNPEEELEYWLELE